ncbi:fungal-specific transcription factor domain-containing protein [Microdochium trichocladiopsis]|uniref:Fungal-specific transcription factor domain-containing protein n=1 Tax=Microdochium trichocladiopsis TaxID=1682393 RepID=A0A9P8YCE8_9PEZI|nr:fungal-specific transcription factor domain-containing protein [Microdochium trichocladiopsis]KAH7035707.1 fungal-specific transcription factor domain-containing protein [Microdochium trichocladiopsis]
MPDSPDSYDGDAVYNGGTPTGSVASAGPAGLAGAPHIAISKEDPASVIKVTRGHSCLLCQQRKVRCDQAKPCSNCVKAGVECRVIPPQPPRRRKKRVPERDLVERLRRYEALLTQAGVEFDGLGPDVKIVDPGTVEDGDELDADFIRVRARDSPAGPESEVISSPGETPHIPKTFKWFPFQKEYRTHTDSRESSDEDDGGSSINNAYDHMFQQRDDFPFAIGAAHVNLTDQHPSAIQIFQLWQVYLNNVNPLLKLTHTPTLQVRIIEAGANLNKVSQSLEALMFSIYLMAISTMQDDEVYATFNEPKRALLGKYCRATQQALLNAEFMRQPDLTILQAFLLYLYGVRPLTDPRQIFCLSGIAVRLGHRLGLHRDGAAFNLSPFEVEERRRLWWNLAGFDRRIGEMTGSTITAISSGGDCKLPLNINDADLHLYARDSPTPHTAATEMIFSLSRLEFHKAPGNDKMKATLSEANPQAVTNLADHRLSTYLERFSSHMEDTYLKMCDPKIPLHYMTILMTRQHICKLKIMSGFFRAAISTAPQSPKPSSPALSQSENDAIFVESIKMIEYDSMIWDRDSLQGYRWYSFMYFPFPAYVCLLHGLRTRTTGELCERAWSAICENHDKRGLLKHLRTPLHIAFGPLFLKSWNAREAAEHQLGRTLAPPKLITVMRQYVANLPKRDRSKSPTHSAVTTPPNMAPPSTGSTEHYVTPSPPPMAPQQHVQQQHTPPATVQQQNYPNIDMYTMHSGVGGPGSGSSQHQQPHQHEPRAYPPGSSAPMPTLNGGTGGVFPELNFGGEMDWDYIMNLGFMVPPQPQPHHAFAGQMHAAQDPNQAQVLW